MRKPMMFVRPASLLAAILAIPACAASTEESARPSNPGTGTGGSSGAGGSDGSGAGAGSGAGGSSGTGGSTGGTAGTGGATGSGGGSATGGTGGSTGGTGAGGSGGSQPPGTLLFDDFEDNDTNGWIADADDGNDKVGNWAVVPDGTNHVYKQQTEYSDPSWAIGGDSRWTDQIVETKVQFTSSSGDGKAFLAARFSSFERYYFIEFSMNDSDGQIKVRKRVDGSTNDILSVRTGGPVVSGTWYTIALSVVGTEIKAFFEGAEVGSGTDADLTVGGIGIGIVDSVAAFDDVKVTSP